MSGQQQYPLPRHLSEEEWRDVGISCGRYQVSTLGRARSLYVFLGRSGAYRLRDEPLILSPTTYNNGYKAIHVRDANGRRRLLTLHRQVALAFIGPPPPGRPFCLHGDGNRTNNELSNLRWGSVAENQRDMVKHGNSLHGERSPFAKLNAVQVSEIRGSADTPSVLAARFGVSEVTITRILERKTWKVAA